MAEAIVSPGVFQRENDISFINPAPVSVGAAIIGPTVKGPVEDPTVVTSYGSYQRLFGDVFDNGTSSRDEYFTSMAVKSYFDQGGNSVLVTRVVNTASGYARAQSTHMSSSFADYGTGSAPFVLKTHGKGTIYNNNVNGKPYGSGSSYELSDGSLASGSQDNLRWEISNINNAKGTFSLSIRRGDDNKNEKVILETFNNVSLDPNSTNYIEQLIGNQNRDISGTSDRVITTGNYVNKSSYVYVSAVNRKTFNYLKPDGTTINLDSEGRNFSGSLPIASSGSFHGGTGTKVASGSLNLYNNIAGSTQGLAVGDYTNVITLLGNKDDYKFNIISAPGLAYGLTGHSTPLNSLDSLAKTRGDAIAVIDLVGYGAANVAAVTTQAQSLNSSYAASYWPWLQQSAAEGKNVWVPASVHVPGVYAFTDNSTAPWFAPAGLVRGGLNVIQAERKLSRTQRDDLYAGNVNPIASFPSVSGPVVYGQKTLQKKASALDRVNVRRLLIELKEFIGNQANNLVFEQNTIATRNNFLASVNPFLESVVQRQGLFAFRVVMDDTNNTADVIDRNQLVGQIFIQPARTAEFIVLDFVVEPTGATFGS